MKVSPLGCILSAACAFTLSYSAFAQDAPPVDTKQLLDALKLVKERRAGAEKMTESKILQELRAAATSNATAIAFYEQTILATQFDGKGHDAFSDWKATQAENLKSDAMQNAVRLHLNYLLLTLQRAKGAPTQQLEAPLLAHIAALTAAGAADIDILRKRDKAQEMKDAGLKIAVVQGKTPPPKEPLFWEQPLLKQGASSSIFVQRYGIQKMFTNLQDWEPLCGNIEGMYQTTLLPYYRENKDPRLLAYWDTKIQKDAQTATASGLSFKIDQFNLVQRPQLLWKRAIDLMAIGQRNRAILDMAAIIKGNPDHQDLTDWVFKLESLLMNPTLGTNAAATANSGTATTPGTAAATGTAATTGSIPAQPKPLAPVGTVLK